MKATVTALLVSRDGARWLPAVLVGVEGQSRRPDRVVAVDTGSSDNAPDLLREGIGVECVHSAPPRTSYGAAVATGLRTLPPADEAEWIWLLHDDSAPAPRALEAVAIRPTSTSVSTVRGGPSRTAGMRSGFVMVDCRRRARVRANGGCGVETRPPQRRVCVARAEDRLVVNPSPWVKNPFPAVERRRTEPRRRRG